MPILVFAPALLWGCTSGELAFFQVDVEVAERVPTVATLSWTSGHPVETAWVEVSTDYGESWAQDAYTGRQAVVWGLKPDSEVQLDVWFRIRDEDYLGHSETITTGPRPSTLPSFQVSGDSSQGLGGDLLLTTTVAAPGAAVLLDADGELRWWYSITNGQHIGRARLAADGQHILVMPVNNSGEDAASLDRYDLTGELLSQIVIPGQHHDFVEHSDGTVAMLVHDERELDGELIRGDAVVEVTPDGIQTEIWSVWDSLEYRSEEADDSETGDWTHANALAFDEAEQLYYVGLLGPEAIAAVERSSGQLRWLLGSADSDFIDEEGEPDVLTRTHQFEFTDGGLLLFENGPTNRQESRAVELAFRPTDAVVHEVWAWESDPPLFSATLGDVERLDSGDTLIDFSLAGAIVQVTPAGDELWRLSAGLGGSFGYMDLIQDLHPTAGTALP